MPSERQGSRWLYDAPDEPAVKEWFSAQPLHAGMEHGPYLGGIVVIQATEKFKQTMARADGQAYIKESERTVYTPYVKVDTRIAYFWDLVRKMSERDDQEYVGVIEPVPVKVIDDPSSAYFNAHLPEGFFVLPITNRDQTTARYLGARWMTAIMERESYVRKLNGSKAEIPVLKGIGTKQSALTPRAWADDNVVMKAETGAIGRALGVAGILVVGTGVATAEDMQEAQSLPSTPTTTEAPQAVLPAVQGAQPDAEPGQVRPPQSDVVAEKTPQDEDAEGQARMRELGEELSREFPDAFTTYLEWYREERQFPAIDQLTGPALKGAIVKLERTLDEQRQAKKEVAADAPEDV